MSNESRILRLKVTKKYISEYTKLGSKNNRSMLNFYLLHNNKFNIIM